MPVKKKIGEASPQDKAKGKAEPRGQAKASVARKADQEKPGTVQCDLSTFNASYYVKLDEADTIIRGHDMFKNIAHFDALTIQGKDENGVSSHIAPFDKKSCRTALQNRSKYDCGFNIFHLDIKSSLSKAIPINEHAVMQFARDNFDDPNGVFPIMVHTAVENPEDNVVSLFGKLQAISPEEPRHAFLFQLADRIKAGADDDEMLQWQQMARSVTVRIHVMPDAMDRLWQGVSTKTYRLMFVCWIYPGLIVFKWLPISGKPA